jgi:hypothetical protein
MALGSTFSKEHVVAVGAAGVGAVAAAFVQSSGIGATLGGNVRDLGLTVLALVLVGMGGPATRAFALGVGAVGVGSLVRNNVLVATGTATA